MLPALLAATALATAPPPVVGGAESQHRAVPALGATDGHGFLLSCTGTLIRPRWVLGAAHCVDDLDAVSDFLTLQARFGDDANSPRERIEIVSMARHPQWREGQFGYDIALFELAEAADVEPVPLSGDSIERDWEGTDLLWVGWGDTDEAGTNDALQRELTAEVVEADETYLRTRASGSANLCYGDSGGPALDFGTSPPSLVAVAAFVYQDDESGGCVGGGTAGVRARIIAPWLDARLDGGTLNGGALRSSEPGACGQGGGAAGVLLWGWWAVPGRRRSRRRPRRATLGASRLRSPPWPCSTASPTTSTSRPPAK